MTTPLITPELRASMDNGLPAQIATCSKSGTPNVTTLSQVYYVDEERLALSFQFFNKTIRNIRENPRVRINVVDISGADWILDLEYLHTETEGPVFDEMDMKIEAIASMTGMSGIFKLRGADIYHVLEVRRIDYTKDDQA